MYETFIMVIALSAPPADVGLVHYSAEACARARIVAMDALYTNFNIPRVDVIARKVTCVRLNPFGGERNGR